MKNNNFQKKLYKIIKTIPKGKVMTYKEVASALGNPLLARAVGNALNKNQDQNVPCHRVIRSDGFIGGYNKGAKKKIEILESEGIKIDKKRYKIII